MKSGKQTNTFIANAVGFSMSPTINPDDKLIIRKIGSQHSIPLGSIVVFYQNDVMISHRLIFKTKRKIVTKGDNVIFFDKPIQRERIIGEVIGTQNRNVYKNFHTSKSRYVSYYFLFYSLFTTLPALFWYKLFTRTLRGRRFLLTLLIDNK